MSSIEQDFNMKFLNKMEKAISEIKNNCSKAIQNLLELQDSDYDKKLLNEISNFKQVLEKRIDNEIYIQNRKERFDVLKQSFKDYFERLKVDENDYIKGIKNYKQDLEYYINNINLSESKESSPNISTNNESNESYGDDEKGSLSLIDGYKSYFKNIPINDSYNCSVCSQEKAIILCDKCQQLFCKGCLEIADKYDKNPNKCEHNIQSINVMKNRNKNEKESYIKSLIIILKRIILKSNYLLNRQSENINAYDLNSSEINHIKKTFFEYPIINDINNINDSIEISYLNSINKILVNLGINNIDINSFNIFEIDKKLSSSLKDILINEEEIDDDDNDVEEDDITDEKNIIKPIKNNGFK
jgi:hypothetical protein